METIFCLECGIEQSLDEYYYNEKSRSLCYKCKSCQREYQKNRQRQIYSGMSKEERKKRYNDEKMKRLSKDFEYNKKLSDARKKWREENPEKIKEHNENTRKNRFKEKVLIILAKGNKCEKCGIENIPIGQWNLHHINPKEKIDLVGKLVGEDKVKEVEKCSLLCCHCHLSFHQSEEYRKTALDFLKENPQWDL